MNVDKDELLSKLKELLKGEVSTISYDTWFAPLGIDSIKDEHIVFTVNSEFQQDFIENKFNNLIFNTLRYITNKEWTFSVIDLSKNQNDNQTIIADKKSNVSDTELENNHQTLNPKYTFETFVVGNNNRFAHAAALAVGNEPGKSYNPLFLYGGVGLGKTHLMQAIGNRILENNPKSNVLYVTSEKFTNQLINAIKDSKTEMFRNKYRNIDKYSLNNASPFIIHYANQPKPWDDPNGKYAEIWWGIAQKSSFYPIILYRMMQSICNSYQPVMEDKHMSLNVQISFARKVADKFFPKGSSRRGALKKVIPKNSPQWNLLKKIYHIFSFH